MFRHQSFTWTKYGWHYFSFTAVSQTFHTVFHSRFVTYRAKYFFAWSTPAGNKLIKLVSVIDTFEKSDLARFLYAFTFNKLFMCKNTYIEFFSNIFKSFYFIIAFIYLVLKLTYRKVHVLTFLCQSILINAFLTETRKSEMPFYRWCTPTIFWTTNWNDTSNGSGHWANKLKRVWLRCRRTNGYSIHSRVLSQDWRKESVVSRRHSLA